MLLPRPHLTEALLDAIKAHSLTVVSAPMGYGKTTLARAAADAVSGEGGEAYYYSAPNGPHDAPFFWHDMFKQLETQGIGIAPAMLRIGFPETASQARQAAQILKSLDAPTCLFLDDYHQVTDAAVNAFLENLVRAGIPNFHVILFSRTRPDISLEELRIKRLAAVFGQDFLAFSEAETREYFLMNGVIEANAAIEAQTYSEGWPAALWLGLQSWLANGRIIDSGDIDSLLAHTVFAAYEPEERDLLMRLSALDYFTEDGADKLAAVPDASARLRTLREKNAFLSFDVKRGYYQFHSIFRDFLRKELAAARHIDKPSLYRLAGECCVEQQRFMSAIRLFALAGRDEDLLRIMDMFLLPGCDKAFVYFQKEIFDVAGAIPWRVRSRHPMGYLAFIVKGLVIPHDRRSAPMLKEAWERLSNAPEMPEHQQKTLRGEFEITRGLAVFNDLWALCEHYEEAFRLLEGPSFILSNSTAWSYGSPSISFISLRERGRYGELVELLERYWNICDKLTNGTTKCGDKALRAEYALERGRFAEAEQLAREILLACRDARQATAALAAAFCLARICLASGKPGEALQVLEDPRSQAERLGVTEYFDSIDMAVGYINSALGRVDDIPKWLRDGEVFDPPHNSLPKVLGLSLTIHGKALMLQGDYRRLDSVADEMTAGASRFDCLFAHIHCKVFKAVAAWHRRGRDKALSFMREVLELSRPDGIILPLAEYGAHIIPILRALKGNGQKDGHLISLLALAERIAHVSERPRTGCRKNLLSPRELEFMRYVSRGMTTPVIAEKLGISRTTVKTTLNRAFAKLDAANRVEAAQRFIAIYGDV